MQVGVGHGFSVQLYCLFMLLIIILIVPQKPSIIFDIYFSRILKWPVTKIWFCLMLDLGFSQIKLKHWRYTHTEIEIDRCNRLLQHGTAGNHGVVNNVESK